PRPPLSVDGQRPHARAEEAGLLGAEVLLAPAGKDAPEIAAVLGDVDLLAVGSEAVSERSPGGDALGGVAGDAEDAAGAVCVHDAAAHRELLEREPRAGGQLHGLPRSAVAHVERLARGDDGPVP